MPHARGAVAHQSYYFGTACAVDGRIHKAPVLSWNAVKRANALGYTQLYWYRDGLDAWEAAGLPAHPAAPEAFP